MATSNGVPSVPGAPASPSSLRWSVDSADDGERLVNHLARRLLISREKASDLIDFGSVHINGHQVKDPSRRLSGSEEIWVHLPWHGTSRFYEIDPNRIVFRDRYLLAYDKEAGIPCQQTPSDAYNNLYAALYRYLKKEATSPYVALHHRLDRETSGVMLFALDRSVNRRLGNAFQEHKAKKDYLAWVGGRPPDEWVSTEDIGRRGGKYQVSPKGQGKSAETLFKTLVRGDDSLIWARPRTGRTHQIRLHLAACEHPILGDRLYGGKPAKRLFLHAYRLKLSHPANESELSVMAPVPEDWPFPQSPVIPD
jgi:23S rRNA pseudouridine1911/1915/1917 synthase